MHKIYISIPSFLALHLIVVVVAVVAIPGYLLFLPNSFIDAKRANTLMFCIIVAVAHRNVAWAWHSVNFNFNKCIEHTHTDTGTTVYLCLFII